MNKEKNLNWMSASPEDVSLVDETIDKMGKKKEVVEAEEEKWNELENSLKKDVASLRKNYDKALFCGLVTHSIKEKMEDCTVNEDYIKDLLGSANIKFTEENKEKLSDLASKLYGDLLEELEGGQETQQESGFKYMSGMIGKEGAGIEIDKVIEKSKDKIVEEREKKGVEKKYTVDDLTKAQAEAKAIKNVTDEKIEETKNSIDNQIGDIPNVGDFEDLMKRENGVDYELSDEQFEKIKLFLERSGENRWRTAYASLNEVAGEDLRLPYYLGTLDFVSKKDDNTVIIEASNDREKFKIEIEFDFDKKSIRVNVVEEILKKTETPEPTPEKEKGPRTIRDLVVILGKLEEYEMFREILNKKETKKAKMKKEMDDKEDAGEEISKEEDEAYDRISKEVQKAMIDVAGSEMHALYAYKVKSGDEETEDWILNRRIEALNALTMQHDILAKMMDAEDKKVERLSKAKRKNINNFCDATIDKVYSKLPNWITHENKGANNNQQTREPRKGWRGMVDRLERKFSKSKTEENENDQEKFNEDELKNAVLAKCLELWGVTNKKKLDDFIDEMKEKDKEKGKKMDVNIEKEKDAKEIAESLLDVTPH